MPRPAGSRNKPKVMHECVECGETGFATKKCPGCGSLKTLELNKDGIPITEVQNAIGAQPQLPIVLGSAPEYMDPNTELRQATSVEQSQAIADMQLDKVKARAAEAKANRIRLEEELEQVEKGFRRSPEEELPNPMLPPQQQPVGGDSSVFLSGLGKWSEEARADLFDRLAADDDFALRFSQAVNGVPQPQMPMNAQQAMNPWMNPMMMQPQAPTEPPESATSMMMAMITAVAQLKELSGGNDDGNNALTERLIAKMDRMEEKHAESTAMMQQKMMELQNAQGQNRITAEDIQQITHSAIANSSTDQLAANIESMKGIVTGLESLGLVNAPDNGQSSHDEFERMKWKDEVTLKREEREREDRKEDRQAQVELAKQQATTGMLSMMMQVNSESAETTKDDDEKEEEIAQKITKAVIS
ncbi:MAG: hypothetical protein U9Q68_05210 [Euryarchaeota archaeon]|nr:hypothetical protein [Euryarchaeota archaeon]